MVEGIALASAVTQGVLLDATAYLTWGITGELDDVEGIQDAGGVLELIVDGVLAVPGRGLASRFAPRTEVFAALGQPVLMRGARPSWDQSQQAGRGMILPACQVDDAGEFTWARRRRSWWCHTCSPTPSTRTPAKRAGAGSSDAACRHGLIWDHTVFHVVPNWRASPEIVAPSKRNCRIAQRIARTPKRARGLVRSPHTQGSQPAGCMTQHRAPEPG